MKTKNLVVALIISIATVCKIFLSSLVTLKYSYHEFNSNRKTSAIVARTPQRDGAACEALMDAMDSRMDRKRAKRQKMASNLKKHNSNIKGDFDLYEPEAVYFTEERFGSGERDAAIGDGPKFVCGVDFLDPKDCLVYSIGSHNQISFEKAVKQFVGCELHTFDPTLEKAFVGSNYATFHPWALGIDGQDFTFPGIDGNITTVKSKSLATIISELGHTGRKIDILKIDCEGCEWEVMPVAFDAIRNGTLDVDQVQIELHHTSVIDPLFAAADRANFRIFHKERNQWGCDGYYCLEYAFVSASFLRRVNSEVACNHRLNGQ
jgi:hypothetical protein